MNIYNYNTVSYLDRIRIRYGVDKFKDFFYQIAKGSREKAFTLLNDKQLSSISLYILIPCIKNLNLYKELNTRNISALKLYATTLKDKSLSTNIDTLCSEKKENIFPALKWILKTGYSYDGVFDEFDEILDITVSTLIITYKDNKILPIVAEMIFERNRKGKLIHELVWAFFESKNLYTLRILANYLKSSNEKDIQLASKLLNIEDFSICSKAEQKQQYESYLLWLNKNYPFLYYTGQDFQLTSKPKPFNIHITSKYLCNSLFNKEKKSVLTQNRKEEKRLEDFNKLNDNDKIILSNISYQIYKKDISLWENWMNQSVENQIEIAAKLLGGK